MRILGCKSKTRKNLISAYEETCELWQEGLGRDQEKPPRHYQRAVCISLHTTPRFMGELCGCLFRSSEESGRPAWQCCLYGFPLVCHNCLHSSQISLCVWGISLSPGHLSHSETDTHTHTHLDTLTKCAYKYTHCSLYCKYVCVHADTYARTQRRTHFLYVFGHSVAPKSPVALIFCPPCSHPKHQHDVQLKSTFPRMWGGRLGSYLPACFTV